MSHILKEKAIELSIVIPAYNEQDRIIPTLKNTLEYLKEKNFKSQVIVVSDGSSDKTAATAKGFCRLPEHVDLTVLEYHPNRGKGYAVQHGMLRANGRIIMFMDADYAVPVQYCETGMELIEQGFDIAIASRTITGARVKSRQNFFRELSARIYTFIQNYYLGVSFPDTQCGFKLFKKKSAHMLFGRQKLSSVIFDPEILWLAKQKRYKVAQFPVQWTHIADSRIQYDSLRKFLFVFQELFRIKKLHT
ncbi:MAG: glycosyltransferase family 2 protein [Desulfobacteraceae bacterium]|nr:glycosyltransferase family 2 protein [Desulfobacteraceae bacterium]